jgi:hypothetical protein
LLVPLTSGHDRTVPPKTSSGRSLHFAVSSALLAAVVGPGCTGSSTKHVNPGPEPVEHKTVNEGPVEEPKENPGPNPGAIDAADPPEPDPVPPVEDHVNPGPQPDVEPGEAPLELKEPDPDPTPPPKRINPGPVKPEK